MATFTDIYKQELKSKGVLGSLGSAGFKRAKERLDPRNILFGGSGIVSATGQKIFGKGYSAIDKSGGKKLSDSGAFNGEIKSEALNALLVSSQKQEAQLSIIAKNTMNNNAMARDMNVMRQNIMKLVTMGGGKASRGSDMFFKDSAAREKAYESQFGKEKVKTVTTTPSKIVEKKEEKPGGILGLLAPLLTLGGTIVSAITGALSGLGTTILEGLSRIFTVDNLMKALGFAKEGLSAIFRIAMMVATNPLFLALAGMTAVAGVLSFLRSDYDGRKEEYLGLAKKKKEQGLSAEEEARLKELNNPTLRSEATKELGYDPIEGKASTAKTPGQIAAEQRRNTLRGPSPSEYKDSFYGGASQAENDALNKALNVGTGNLSTQPASMGGYKSRAGVGRDTSPSREMDSGKQKLLDFIAQKESGAFGYNALVYGNGTPKTADLTNMTLQEVFDYQSGMISRGHASSAVGRYQFINETLREFAKKAGVSSSEKFTPEVQDRIAGALLDQVGYQKLISGKMTMEDFQNRLAGRWASLPRTDGTSQYAGKNGNKVLTTSDTLKNVITASMTTPATGATLASASTASSDMRASLSAPTPSAPITISTSNSVKNSQAIVASKSQVGDYSFQTATL